MAGPTAISKLMTTKNTSQKSILFLPGLFGSFPSGMVTFQGCFVGINDTDSLSLISRSPRDWRPCLDHSLHEFLADAGLPHDLVCYLTQVGDR